MPTEIRQWPIGTERHLQMQHSLAPANRALGLALGHAEGMGFDVETWQRVVLESLRDIDPEREFYVSTLVLGFEDEALGLDPDDFPADELLSQVNAWLETLDPDITRREWLSALEAEDAGKSRRGDDGEFTVHGTTLVLRAHGRPIDQRGWRVPSLRELEEPFAPIELADGTQRSLLDLSLEDVQDFATGRVKRRGATAGDRWLQLIADQMTQSGWAKVADADPMVINTWAGSLGLVSAPPDLGPPQGF